MAIAPTGVRIPPDMKQRLVERAKSNSRSLNNEVVHRLKESLAKENAPEAATSDALEQ